MSIIPENIAVILHLARSCDGACDSLKLALAAVEHGGYGEEINGILSEVLARLTERLDAATDDDERQCLRFALQATWQELVSRDGQASSLSLFDGEAQRASSGCA